MELLEDIGIVPSIAESYMIHSFSLTKRAKPWSFWCRIFLVSLRRFLVLRDEG